MGALSLGITVHNGQAVCLTCEGTGLPCVYFGICHLALTVVDRSIWCSSGAVR